MSDKLFSIFRIILLVLGTIFGVWFFIAVSKVETSEVSGLLATDMVVYLTYGFIVIAGVAAIVAPIIILAKNPKNAKNALIGIIALAVLFFGSYFLSSGDVSSEVLQKFDITPAGSKLIGAGLLLTYILLGISLFLTAFSGITKIFKQ